MPNQPLGPVRCPACGQKALPMQTRCLSCNARLNQALPIEATPLDAILLPPPAPVSPADGKCPGCARELPAQAVLCIECGYDLRTGRKRQTVHAPVEEEPESAAPGRPRNRRREPLPAGLGYVQLGLGFHYARLLLTLLAILAIMVLLCYAGTAKPRPDNPALLLGGLAAVGIVLLAAVLGMVGSILCLWVGRASGAWWFIFLSLLLDVLTPPPGAALQIAGFPPFLGWGVAFVSWIFFMLFLRRLALYVDRPGEANEVMALITRGVALLVGVPLLLVLLARVAFLYAFTSKTPVLLLLGVSTLIVVVQFVFLIKLFLSIIGNIQTLRAALASPLSRSE